MPMRTDNPKQWIPPPSKPDQECTLLELWSRYHKKIAIDRNFCSPDSTIASYTSTLHVIQDELKKKPAAKMDPYDCWEAARSVQFRTFKDGSTKPYAETTFQKRLVIIKDIFIYSEKCAICVNPLWMPPWELINDKSSKQTDFSLSITDIKGKIHTLSLKQRNKEKYILTPEQEHELLNQIQEHILEDGRWAGLLIYLCLGVRPAEGRNIDFADLLPFAQDPKRHYVRILGTTDRKGNRRDTMKNKYSYRLMPVPLEMQTLLSKREEFIKNQFNQSNINDFPIICKGNDYGVPCTDAEMAVFAQKVLVNIVSPATLAEMLVDLYGETEQQAKESVTAMNLTAYALRHNFCTRLHSETQLDDEEIRLLMGHSTGKSLRNMYSERRVYEMMEKMDHRMMAPHLHPGWCTDLKKGDSIDIKNFGIHYLRISADQMAKGIKINIMAESMAAGDALVILLKELLPNAKITRKEVRPLHKEFRTQSVSTNYDHWDLPEW